MLAVDRLVPRPAAWRRARALLALFVCLLAPASALAINQPDGTPIPQRNDLQNLFNSRGEGAINAVRDAAIMPERFVPGCRLTFTLVSRGAALFQNSFGWYNVTGSRPAESDLHVLIPCTAGNGFVATLDLRTETAYRGGEIGFFLRTPESGPGSGNCSDCCGRPGAGGFTYYTEREFNPDNMGASSYIHLLTYDSRVTPAAFYFAWEDLYGGGDNEFTDFVAEVSNIVCSGAGAPCMTGMMGACGQGTQQCRAGRLQCVTTNVARPEVCDGIDNDCNGMTDDGMNLCPTGQVCDRGVCVPRCVEGGCFAGQTCTTRGTCVETACATVTCPDQQRCIGGRCVGACDGVYCPPPTACRLGRCVDPCAGVMCDADQVCEDGMCVARCPCRRCPTGTVCQMDGHCVPMDCATVTCPMGMTCRMGRCVDACMPPTPDQMVCGHGEQCVNGRCVPSTGGTGMDGGVGALDGGARTDGGRTDGGRTDGGTRRDGGTVGGDDGCGCRTAGRTGGGGARNGAAALLALATAAAAGARRRQRGRRGARAGEA